MPEPPPRAKFNPNINPLFNPSINPKSNAALNPVYSSGINPQRNPRISPKFNRSLDPLTNAALSPTANASINPKETSRFSGLCRWTPDAELVGYIGNTPNKAVLLLFDVDLEWKAYAVDNLARGYNVFDLEGEWERLSS